MESFLSVLSQNSDSISDFVSVTRRSTIDEFLSVLQNDVKAVQVDNGDLIIDNEISNSKAVPIDNGDLIIGNEISNTISSYKKPKVEMWMTPIGKSQTWTTSLRSKSESLSNKKISVKIWTSPSTPATLERDHIIDNKITNSKAVPIDNDDLIIGNEIPKSISSYKKPKVEMWMTTPIGKSQTWTTSLRSKSESLSNKKMSVKIWTSPITPDILERIRMNTIDNLKMWSDVQWPMEEIRHIYTTRTDVPSPEPSESNLSSDNQSFLLLKKNEDIKEQKQIPKTKEDVDSKNNQNSVKEFFKGIYNFFFGTSTPSKEERNRAVVNVAGSYRWNGVNTSRLRQRKMV